MTESDFHSTLEQLRERRDEIERAFDAGLEELDRRVGEARSALERAAEVADAAEDVEPPNASDPRPSPAGIRGRLAAWLLGDELAALDRRQRDLARAVEALKRDGVSREHLESVRELAGRATEATETGAGLIRALKSLLNAKEAETVHVASHGARAQAELTLEELARQQEALLSELIGKRQELDRRLERSEPNST